MANEIAIADLFPYKKKETETEYALKLKQTLRNVHIFISSDVDEDVAFIRKRFYEWRNLNNGGAR